MGLFVSLLVEADLCATRPECRECVLVCPVDIFGRDQGRTAHVIEDNEDECILCDLCVVKCPVEAVSLVKHY